MTFHAVITGDLIGSSKVNPTMLSETMANIANTAQFLTEFTGEDTRFTRFRGDGWQIVLSPAFYLRAVALIHANLKASQPYLSTRLGIGFGPVDSLGTADLSDAHGAAFVHSGHALDSLKRDQMIRLSREFALGDVMGNSAERLRGAVKWSDAAILPMFSFIAGRWSQAQAEALAVALKDDRQTQATMAEQLGITRQALNLRLTGAGYGRILTAIRLTETYFDEIRRDTEARATQ